MCAASKSGGRGKAAVRRGKRAQILLAASAGATDEGIAANVRVGTSTVYRTKRRLVKIDRPRFSPVECLQVRLEGMRNPAVDEPPEDAIRIRGGIRVVREAVVDDRWRVVEHVVHPCPDRRLAELRKQGVLHGNVLRVETAHSALVRRILVTQTSAGKIAARIPALVEGADEVRDNAGGKSADAI